MKIHLLGIAAITLLSSGHVLAQLLCNRGAVGELACKDQEVKTLVRRIGLEAKRLGCVGAEHHELETVKRAWGWRQYECASSTDLRACVVRSLQSEANYLQGMGRCEVASHPVKFETTVPSYVLAHLKDFVGSDMSIMGEVALADCTPSATSVVGKVREYKNEKAVIEIRFKSLPDVQRSFLCRRPSSSWRGIVRLTDKGVPYLYATDVLGVPLP